MDDPLLILDVRPTRSDAVKNRELLMRTAVELFAQRGVEHVTMSEIAQVAGVGKGTLYRHFSSKNDLAHALLDQDQRHLQAETLTRLPKGNPPLDDLRWFVEQVAHFVTRNLPLLSVMGETEGTAGTLPLSDRVHYWWWQTIRALLTRARISGDLDYLADTLYVLLSPQTIRHQTAHHGFDLARIVRGLNQIIDRLDAMTLEI
jgi:AcrR family transcriptional regulator